MKKLVEIQHELKVPKNNFNEFAKYNFRNAEDILEALKPILKKYNCILNLSDEIINLNNRYYVKTTVKIIDVETREEILSTGFAREPESKKGFDESQITGAASSYARKYALNGLFAIDDNKDADNFDNTCNTKKIKDVFSGKQVNHTEKEFESLFKDFYDFVGKNQDVMSKEEFDSSIEIYNRCQEKKVNYLELDNFYKLLKKSIEGLNNSMEGENK